MDGSKPLATAQEIGTFGTDGDIRQNQDLNDTKITDRRDLEIAVVRICIYSLGVACSLLADT